MALETSPEKPAPLRVIAQAVADWVNRLGTVWVEGQITQVTRRPGAGTVFLTLRDTSADVSMSVTCQRRVLDALGPAPADGARVVVRAKPQFYVARGTLSLRAEEIRQIGIGELLARIEQLKRMLGAEGLFDRERKRPLPFLPHQVGLVCGRGSAAERDVLENARRRWPAVRFRVLPVAVQGVHAVAQVSEAVRELDADPGVDVIVVARGGGSVEDLLPFSDERLIRTVAACRTPVVSAIGHEPDTPLLDFVADLRASTPTDAAKKVVPDVREEMQRVRDLLGRARQVIRGRLDREQAGLDGMRSRPVLADPGRMLTQRQEEVVALVGRARRCLGHRLDAATADLAHTLARVTALSPAATLERGYAVVQRADGAVVRSPAEVAAGDRLRTRLAHGELAVTVAPSADGEDAATATAVGARP